jgi:hypothetical protein
LKVSESWITLTMVLSNWSICFSFTFFERARASSKLSLMSPFFSVRASFFMVVVNLELVMAG